MALVLTGLPVYKLFSGGRVHTVRHGEGVDNLGLTEDQLNRLRALMTITRDRKRVLVFSDVKEKAAEKVAEKSVKDETPAPEKKPAAKKKKAAAKKNTAKSEK